MDSNPGPPSEDNAFETLFPTCAPPPPSKAARCPSSAASSSCRSRSDERRTHSPARRSSSPPTGRPANHALFFRVSCISCSCSALSRSREPPEANRPFSGPSSGRAVTCFDDQQGDGLRCPKPGWPLAMISTLVTGFQRRQREPRQPQPHRPDRVSGSQRSPAGGRRSSPRSPSTVSSLHAGARRDPRRR
jgi:hypothetical protein